MKVKLLTWFWQDQYCRTRYKAEHVNIWAHMMRRNINDQSLVSSIACVTDTPEGIEPWIEIIKPPNDFVDYWVPSWSLGKPQCYRRVALFRPDAAKVFGAERMLSMDMDCVALDTLDSLINRDEDVVFLCGEPRHTRVRPYNGSMVMLTAGCRPQVWLGYDETQVELASEQFDGSDQARYAYVLGDGEAKWAPPDVQWMSSIFKRRNHERPVDCKLVFFHGNLKPWEKHDLKWVAKDYRLDSPNQLV